MLYTVIKRVFLKFGVSEKATKFEKNLHRNFDNPSQNNVKVWRRPQNLKKIFIVLLTRASCSVRATAYLSKRRRRFFKTNVDKLYYTNLKKTKKKILESNRNQIWRWVYCALKWREARRGKYALLPNGLHDCTQK